MTARKSEKSLKDVRGGNKAGIVLDNGEILSEMSLDGVGTCGEVPRGAREWN
jgi:hypothetical protein